MIPAPVKAAAQFVIEDENNRVEIKIPSNARPRAFADLLRRELNAYYGSGMIRMATEQRKTGAWLHVMKPEVLPFTDRAEIAPEADTWRMRAWQDGSAI